MTDKKLHTLFVDSITNFITSQKFEEALTMASKQEQQQPWNGEGLPPVGTVCIVTPHNGQWGFKFVTDYNCKILAYFDDYVWLLDSPESKESSHATTRTDKVDFRPIPTPEQIEAERAERVCQQLLDVWSQPNIHDVDTAIRAMYDAIRAGKIEGVMIDG